MASVEVGVGVIAKAMMAIYKVYGIAGRKLVIEMLLDGYCDDLDLPFVQTRSYADFRCEVCSVQVCSVQLCRCAVVQCAGVKSVVFRCAVCSCAGVQ